MKSKMSISEHSVDLGGRNVRVKKVPDVDKAAAPSRALLGHGGVLSPAALTDRSLTVPRVSLPRTQPRVELAWHRGPHAYCECPRQDGRRLFLNTFDLKITD